MRIVSKGNRILLALLIILLAVIMSLGVYGYIQVLNSELIHQGVKVDQYDISLLTKENATDLIKNIKNKELKQKSMKLFYLEKEYQYNLEELGFYYSYEDTMNEAYSIGRTGNVLDRIKDIYKARKNGVTLPLNLFINKEDIGNKIDIITGDIERDAADAEFKFNNGNITVTGEVVGRIVNKEKLGQLIKNNADMLVDLQIPVEEIIPNQTKDLLSRINGVIGEFSTSFTGSTANRIENIRLSSYSIKGKMLMPGESLSFNKTTGPREGRFGYKEASVIIEGDFTPAIGGGVCQTSTTFYNALLLADITILERSPHSIPAKYVEFGQDAAVASGYLDLKIRNDFDFPVYFDARIIGNRIHFYVYGDKQSRDYSVRIDSIITETIPYREEVIVDKALESGARVLEQEGRNGYRVNTYKSIIKNGEVISKDLINKDFYRPRNYIYKIGESTTTSTDLDGLIEDYEPGEMVEDGEIDHLLEEEQ